MQRKGKQEERLCLYTQRMRNIYQAKTKTMNSIAYHDNREFTRLKNMFSFSDRKQRRRTTKGEREREKERESQQTQKKYKDANM